MKNKLSFHDKLDVQRYPPGLYMIRSRFSVATFRFVKIDAVPGWRWEGEIAFESDLPKIAGTLHADPKLRLTIEMQIKAAKQAGSLQKTLWTTVAVSESPKSPAP